MNARIAGYGLTIIGTGKKKGVPCQDAHIILHLKEGCVLAVVADGVGSSKHSDIAARIAVESVAQYFQKKKLGGDINKLMQEAFASALSNIQAYMRENASSEDDYDTTLHAVIYDGFCIHYGHVGDGGVVCLRNDGEYVAVTKPQKGADFISVIPLRAGPEAWEFGYAEGRFASVLLATDGVYDTFFPYLLRGQNPGVYVPMLKFYMDNNELKMTEKNCKDIENAKREFLNGPVCKGVTDDKTIVVLVNSDVSPAKMGEDYYREPDWEALKLEWNKKAYPHLFKD